MQSDSLFVALKIQKPHICVAFVFNRHLQLDTPRTLDWFRIKEELKLVRIFWIENSFYHWALKIDCGYFMYDLYEGLMTANTAIPAYQYQSRLKTGG